jgi:glycosyltransferase involved in cell wall biosynthesis
MLLSCDSFERFFGGNFGIDREQYIASYRNDFAWEYASGLQKLGHEVVIYILSYGPHAYYRIDAGLGVRFLHLPRWFQYVDSILWRLRFLLSGTLVREAIRTALFEPELTRALASDRIDVLYLQEFWTHRFDQLARRVRAIPLVAGDHGAPYVAGMDRFKRTSLQRVYMVTCQHERDLERVQRLGGNAVLLRNGVDTTFFHPAKAAAHPKTILAVGRLDDDQKRFSDMIRAMAWLPEFNLRIVGTGPDEAALKVQIARSAHRDRVHMAGFISSREALRDQYQRCGVYVSASAREAVQLTMLEAMSCGASVVGTRIPTFEELLEDGVNGRLVPVGAPERLAEAIRDAYLRRHSYGVAARATVERRHSAESVYARLSTLLEAAVVRDVAPPGAPAMARHRSQV